MTTTSETDTLSRLARWIGDLDHPFYEDERNRWVWYEASAIGIQVALIGSYLAGTIVVLALGADSIPWVVAMMLPTTVASGLMAAHVDRHAATYSPSLLDFRRPRGVMVGAIVAAFVLAVLAVSVRDDAVAGIGVGIGALVGLVAVALGARSQRRRVERLDTVEE